MKKRNNYFREKKMMEICDISYNDYIEMFEEGYSDNEISNDLGINEDYVKKLRQDYQNDF